MTRRPEIEKALRYVLQHLEAPLQVAQVAREVGVSEFHFQRLFHSQVGETLGRFITRKRLELSALRLAYEPTRSITDIALSSGYSSTSNFSKAFASYFGCSPTQVREPEGVLPARVSTLTTRYGKSFSPDALYVDDVAPGRWSELVRYENVGVRSFACLSAPGGYELGALEATWVELISRAQQLGLVAEAVDAWGLSHDSPQLTAPELCRYDACIPCAPDARLPNPLFRLDMAAGRYAVFPFEGPVAEVEDAYRSIYSGWFPASSLTPDDFSPLDHYVADFPRDGRVTLEMWFRVRPRE